MVLFNSMEGMLYYSCFFKYLFNGFLSFVFIREINWNLNVFYAQLIDQKYCSKKWQYVNRKHLLHISFICFLFKNMIDFAMTTPIEDVEVHHFPLEIISEILQQVHSLIFLIIYSIISYSMSSNNLIFRDMFTKMSLWHWHLY